MAGRLDRQPHREVEPFSYQLSMTHTTDASFFILTNKTWSDNSVLLLVG